MANTIQVRLSEPHSIFYEERPNGGVIHLTGLDPVDGQKIVTPEGEVLTPIHEVERTPRVIKAITEKRLIDMRDDDEIARINQAVEAARAKRLAERPPTPTHTLSDEELDLRLKAVYAQGFTDGKAGVALEEAAARAQEAAATEGAKAKKAAAAAKDEKEAE